MRCWSITDARVMHAMIGMGPRHVGHARGSTSKLCWRRAEPAGEGQQILVRAGVAADAREAVREHAARQKLVGYLSDDGTPRAVLAGEAVVVDRRHAQQRLVRRRAQRREFFCRDVAVSRCAHRQTCVALSGRAPRALGLRPTRAAQSRHGHARRQKSRCGRGTDEARGFCSAAVCPAPCESRHGGG